MFNFASIKSTLQQKERTCRNYNHRQIAVAVAVTIFIAAAKENSLANVTLNTVSKTYNVYK